MVLTRGFRHLHRNWVQWCVIGLLGLGAVVSVSIGIKNAVDRSQDFQWSPERLVLQHIDPWAEYLKGDPDHHFIDTQLPNYLPSLYVLILPLGLLPQGYAKVLWALCNVLFAVGSGLTLGRVFGLLPRVTVVLVFLLLMATATRNTIGNGQQGLLVLLLWCLSMLLEGNRVSSLMLLGLSYFKFSFSPPLALFTALRSGTRGIVLSLVPLFAAMTGMWFWLAAGSRPASFLRFALEPIAVAKTGFRWQAGDPNLMALLEDTFSFLPGPVIMGVTGLIAIFICVLVGVAAFRRDKETTLGWQMSVLATMSYVLFEHHPYDAVVLAIPLAYALSQWKERKAHWVFAILGYFFYGERVVQALHLGRWWLQYTDFGMLLCLLAFTYLIEGKALQSRSPRQGRIPIRSAVGDVEHTGPLAAWP